MTELDDFLSGTLARQIEAETAIHNGDLTLRMASIRAHPPRQRRRSASGFGRRDSQPDRARHARTVSTIVTVGVLSRALVYAVPDGGPPRTVRRSGRDWYAPKASWIRPGAGRSRLQ